MANIHFIGGEKGGVGKSLMSRVLAQYMIDREIPFIGFDTDRSHGALMRFYSGYASPALVDNLDALDSIIEAAAEKPERRVLVDLAAQTHDPLVKWMDDAGVLNLADEMGMKIFYWHVLRHRPEIRGGAQPDPRQRLHRARTVGRAGARDSTRRESGVGEEAR
jgi:hypothetical protein